MISSKTIDLLNTFSEEEFRKFGHFVSSPYFNKENIQIKFYGILKKNYPGFENRNFEKEKIFAKLYPGKKYNDGVMRNILSGMLELAQNFLAVQNLKNKEFDFSLALLIELIERKMNKLFDKAESIAETYLKNITAKDDRYYYDNYRLAALKRLNKTRQKSSLYNTEIYLPEMANNLTISFIINILKNSTYMANTNLNMFKFDYDINIVNELEQHLEREADKYRDITYIQFFYNAYKLAKTEDETYFYALKNIAKNEYENLSLAEKRDIFTILTNYCYYKINKGDLKFRKEHFLIHKENIEKGNYKGEKQFLNHIQYINVVVTGIDAGEIEWVENFIENYKKDLDKNNMDNTYNFCKALVFYHHKKYIEAFDWAARVKTDDLSYKHQLKSLYLKIYFDMNETEPFYSHVDSYKHFLSNEKHIPEATKEVLGNYVNYTKKLFDYMHNKTEKEFELVKLRREITENRSLVNKLWLLERTDDLTGNKK